MKISLKNVFLTLTILFTVYTFYLGCDTNPDIKLWNWFGYKFGANFTDHLVPKMLAMVSMILYIVTVSRESEQTSKS